MKKISVIIPVYNAEKWVSETLDSLVKQTYQNIEIICVDDGSSDGSCAVIESYQKQFDNIRLVKQENAGVSAARNTGIQNVSGEYIAFVDADDFVEAEMYEKMIERLEAEETDIVFCRFVRFWPNGHKQYCVEESMPALVKNPHDIRPFLYSTPARVDGETLYTKDIHGSACRSVFKKSIIDRNYIEFHTDLRFAEDQIFMLEYLSCCDMISFVDEPYVWYRGWTKADGYDCFYKNQMNLVRYQMQIVRDNKYYSDTEKKQIIGYLKCSAYFVITNDEFVYNPKATEMMREYSKNEGFDSLLSVYNFAQKYKARPDPKRIVLFILLKMKMWETVKRFYPNKKY